MVFFILISILVGLLFGIYQRYVPVYGVKFFDIEKETPREHITLLDLRDYNLAAKHPVKGVYHLPYAYLKRHYGEIGSKEIVVVVSDRLLLNLSVRFLRRKGFHIVGCYITDYQDRLWSGRGNKERVSAIGFLMSFPLKGLTIFKRKV